MRKEERERKKKGNPGINEVEGLDRSLLVAVILQALRRCLLSLEMKIEVIFGFERVLKRVNFRTGLLEVRGEECVCVCGGGELKGKSRGNVEVENIANKYDVWTLMGTLGRL